MILSLPSDITLEDYVQAGVVAGDSWGRLHGDPDGDYCQCGGPPPPAFNLPPPPRPPDHPPLGDCDGLSCAGLLGARGGGGAGVSAPPRAPLAVILVSVATLLVLLCLGGLILCRLRGRGRPAKGCRQLSGAIIYDDLPSAPTLLPSPRTRARHKSAPGQVRGVEEELGMTMGVHLYPETHSHPPSEHLYQSISSGSETCSYSTSEATGQDGRALLRPRHHRHHLQQPPVQRGTESSSAGVPDSDSEEEPLRPGGSDLDTPTLSPAHYYCPSAPPRSSSPGSDYESVYYVGSSGRGSRPATPQERGLPPLPSRSDRFRIYFSAERGHPRAPATRRPPPRRHNLHHSRPPEIEPLYQNLTLT